MKRLLKHMFRNWKWTLLSVALLIVVSTLCTLAMTLFTRTLIDGYILPLSEQADPDFNPLGIALIKLSAVLLVGTLASFLFNFLMIKVEQGIIRQLRTDSFDHLLKDGFTAEYGAREMDRVIAQQLKPLLMREILFGSLKKGGNIKIEEKDGNLSIG